MVPKVVLVVTVIGAVALCGCIAVLFAQDLGARTGILPWQGDRTIDRAAIPEDIDPSDPVAVGEHLFNRNCAGCHSIDGSSRTGPTMASLYGSEVRMDDESIFTVGQSHLYTAITDPRQTTRKGFPDVMPSFERVTDDEINALVAFIQSLE